MTRAAHRWIGLVVALGGGLVPAIEVRSEPLAPEACTAIEAEHAALATAGLPEIVEKGPAWARANLPAEKLKDVKRFIDLREQLLFRCGHDKKRATPATADGEDGAVGAAAKAEKPPPLPRRKPDVRDVKRAAAPAVPTGAGERPRPAPKPRPKPKPKIDDAYRPPPKAPAKAP